MKCVWMSIVVLVSGLSLSCESFGQDELAVLEGPYIGQKPPGLTPEVFAPGVVSTGVRDWTGHFTPDMKEYYFGRYDKKTGKSSKFVFRFENNRWREYEVARHLGGSISPDGKTMHAGNQYRKRTANGWSELKSLGSPFADIPIMVLTASADGTYVFDEREEIGTIRYSRLIDGVRQAPKAFGKEINSGKWTANGQVATATRICISAFDSRMVPGVTPLT